MEESSYSSFYSSVLKTESSTESQQERQVYRFHEDFFLNKMIIFITFTVEDSAKSRYCSFPEIMA